MFNIASAGSSFLTIGASRGGPTDRALTAGPGVKGNPRIVTGIRYPFGSKPAPLAERRTRAILVSGLTWSHCREQEPDRAERSPPLRLGEQAPRWRHVSLGLHGHQHGFADRPRPSFPLGGGYQLRTKTTSLDEEEPMSDQTSELTEAIRDLRQALVDLLDFIPGLTDEVRALRLEVAKARRELRP